MIDPGKGILLISDPFLQDPNFMRTVVLLCEHQEEGSFGFVLNRLHSTTMDQLIPDLDDHPIPVYYGGPVQLDTIHFLHQCPDDIPGGIEILEGVYWGGDFSRVIDMIRSNSLDQDKIRFYIGYSGWSQGQLTDEMNEKSWLTVKADPSLIFHPNEKEIWKDSLRHLGGDYEILINFPIDPQLN